MKKSNKKVDRAGGTVQKKIQELAAGKCGSVRPTLRFIFQENQTGKPPENAERKLDIEVLEGKSSTGEFSIESTNGIPLRGIVYSSNPRMECQNPQFQGTRITINYKFHSEGLLEGDFQKGFFYIICNGGEYDLPFVVGISRKYADSSLGKIKTVFEFANLARKSYEEAVKVFGQPEFEHIFHSRDERERMIYRSLCRKDRLPDKNQVEEFLIAVKKKERISFQVEEKQQEFYGVTRPEKQHITLKKDTWGYLEIEVSSDNPCIRLEKHMLTSEDFVGNHAMAEYIIAEKYLHPGKNYARITFQNQFQKETAELCIHTEEKGVQKERFLLQKQNIQLALTKDYINFRLHKLGCGAWAKNTCEHLDKLMASEPGNLWLLLGKAQVLLVNRQRQDAEWILDSFKREYQLDKNSPLYAYYLYLCTLREPEPAFVNKLTKQIREIYRKNRENTLLLWIMLFLDEELNYNQARKLEVITARMEQGGSSPLLYIEAYQIIQRAPYLLRKTELPQRNLLYWAVKQQAVTKELAAQVRKMLPEIRGFHPIWYKIACECYQKFPERELLQEICGCLIKWNCYDSAYQSWYELGIEEELRIAGLYEAWLFTAGKKQLAQVPKIIAMYFQYHSNLPYGQQAKLYAALIKHRAAMKGMHQTYRKNMETFVIEQLSAGRIDSNLSVIYEEILTDYEFTEESAEWLSQVLFVHRITCTNPNAMRLVVRQRQFRQEQVVSLNGQTAYVTIYDNNCCIMLEDAKGRRFLPEDSIFVKPLMNTSLFLEKGMEKAREKMRYLWKYFEGKKIWQTYEKEDLPYLREMTASELISSEYREELRHQMIAYYYDNYTGDTLDEFLLSLSFEGIEKRARGKLMELLVARHHFEKAYELVVTYGSENLSAAKLVSVISSRMAECGQEDAYLTGLCRSVFLRGKYNDCILEYMCRYFCGSLKEMTELWKTAQNFEMDTFELEERCLSQYLFTGDFFTDMQPIFESYDKKEGREVVIAAYLSKMSHQYVTRDAVVADYVFERISRQFASEKPSLTGDRKRILGLNKVCRIGFLKWCASGAIMTELRKEQAELILRELWEQEEYFSFYQGLPKEFAGKYLYYDRTYLEYRTASNSRVVVSYQPVGSKEYVDCEMKQMYEGVFVKDFVVFFGEKIPYYIKEEQDRICTVTQSGHIQNQSLCINAEGSRYDLLNDIMISHQMEDETTLRKRLEEYQSMASMVEQQFTII